jgi:hypothetical protein
MGPKKATGKKAVASPSASGPGTIQERKRKYSHNTRNNIVLTVYRDTILAEFLSAPFLEAICDVVLEGAEGHGK